MRRVTRTFAVAALATALAVVTGCSSDEPEDTTNAGSGGELAKVTYLTSFGNFGRDAYGWVALEKGFFREAGFDVTIQKGQGTGGNITTIVSGKADYTPIDLTGGLLTFGKGTKDFTAVAAIQQRTMAAIASTSDKKITTPKDLEGKTLADTPGSVVRNLFPTYAKLANVDYNKVKWQDGEAATLIATLGSGKVDGIGQFVVGRPTIEAVTKKTPTFLPYSDYLTDLYGNVLITSTKNAKEKPEEVKRFTQALLKGLEYSLANPEEAGKILQSKDNTANPAAAKAELELMASFVRSAGSGEKIGTIDTQRVARSIAILQGAGQLPQGITPEQIISVDLLPKV
ncbi:ABC transporter substrate-binding protein [Phytohabitans sp. ZYX-F-186]|uniref:Thiamine pyrimidine synthase n=1 Tax=Phytohabitans maris TaxID=3071409 RepID=A0ABU0Z8G1_9ACTN|nr:ABC transporter substrate-binding protein [Phytohabitans sp. ZYX-F-186]MDQ7903346.1 ABC transporter substrate-binding protein [Phytohabitans sp. ZYX-F-186]